MFHSMKDHPIGGLYTMDDYYDDYPEDEIDRDTERKIKEYEEKEKIRIVILIQQNFRNKHYIKELQKINICNDLIGVILKYL